jgi:hypothetical protein
LLVEIKEINLVVGAHYHLREGRVSAKGGDSLEGLLEKSCKEDRGEF